MNTTRLKQARRLFQHDLASQQQVRHNIRAWARSLRLLGGNWRGIAVRLQRQEQ